MSQCNHSAVLIIAQNVIDTTTSVARERIQLCCGLPEGHAGQHRDVAHNETWEGERGKITTLLRQEEGEPAQ